MKQGMDRITFLSVFLLWVRIAVAQIRPVDCVDVFTGTSNSRWMLGPYACVPFGMVQPGPDNQGDVWMGGYEHSIRSVRGFSHLHGWTMAGLSITLPAQDLTVKDSQADTAFRGAGAAYHSRMIPDTETARPGYYSVGLYDARAKAELTATTRCAFHRYTFEKMNDARIMIDLAFPAEYPFTLREGSLACRGDTVVEGFAVSRTHYGDYTLYFTIRFSRAFQSFNGWMASGEIERDIRRSENWKNLFHPEWKFVVPRDISGNWIPDFNPFSGYSFSEGNSWQYSWYVPHDIPGLVKVLGPDLFNARLEEGFRKSEERNFAAHAFDRSRTTVHEYYINHGNQANMQAAWLFNYSGKPWLTQKYTRAIMDRFYGNSPYHGWEGDEDEGQMGAWYVMSAMGFFEMNGGTSPDLRVDLTGPLFDRITIRLDRRYYPGNAFVIETRNQSKENVYIRSVSLNDQELKNPRISFRDITAGGRMVFEMAPNSFRSIHQE